MGTPAATANGNVVALDTHIVLVPSPGGPIPVPLPHPFSGTLVGGLVPTVMIGGQPAAVQGSIALNNPPHIPMPPGASFQKPPTNQGSVEQVSQTVKLGGKGAARVGDTVKTCNDPADQPVGVIVGPVGTVMIG